MNVNESVKRPIILLRTHEVTQLVIRHVHELFHHHNNDTVVNEIRQKFYIPQLRVAVKNVILNCQVCKNKNARPQCLKMASLPKARLATFCRTFSFVEVDYFGPLYVTVGRHSIYSDNGTNFKGPSKEEADAVKNLDKRKIQEKATKSGIKWFLTPICTTFWRQLGTLSTVSKKYLVHNNTGSKHKR